MITDIGRKTMHLLRMLETCEVKMTRAMSGIPKPSFKRRTSIIERGARNNSIAALSLISVLNSQFLKYELKSCVLTKEHA